jgi:hypothetical protein
MVSSIDSKYFLCTDKTISSISADLSTKTSKMDRLLWEHTAGKAYEHTLPNATSLTATEAATGTGIMAGLKKFWTFIMGEWGKPLGDAYRNAKKLNPNLKITDFAWGSEYGKITAKQAAEKLAEAGVKKGGLSKLLGKLSPLLIAGFTLYEAFNGFKAGGLPEAIKETAKGIIGLVGFAVGSVIAGVLGLGAIGTFFVPLLVSMVAGWCATKVLGESKAEEQAQLAEQQQLMQQQMQSPMNFKGNPLVNDPMLEYIRQKDNPFATQYSQNQARSQYAF